MSVGPSVLLLVVCYNQQHFIRELAQCSGELIAVMGGEGVLRQILV